MFYVQQLLLDVNAHVLEYEVFMEKNAQRDALRVFLAISRLGNGYLTATTPWKLAKIDKAQCVACLCIVLHAPIYHSNFFALDVAR